jgi:hypothetical protein
MANLVIPEAFHVETPGPVLGVVAFDTILIQKLGSLLS